MSVQWLTTGTAAGNALICDQGSGSVVEVRSTDYDHGFDAGSVVWEYPTGGGSGQPGCALGMFGSDGVVWISDSSEWARVRRRHRVGGRRADRPRRGR